MASEIAEAPEHLKMLMESMEEGEEHAHGEHGGRFKTVVALLLGLVTILGGFVAWRIAVAYEHAGVTDLAGLAATINAEETHTLDTAQLYEHYRAYTSYVANQELAAQIAGDLKSAPADQAAALKSQMDEARGLAAQNQDFFPKRYLNPDETYNTQRELGEAWADAARAKDLTFTTHFQEADQLRDKTNKLFVALMLLGGALWFYTLAEILAGATRFGSAGVGLFLTLAAIAIVGMAELAA
ncbi:MAG: hypothetical protein WCF84_10675 [Anaerolineae bacterium]